MIAHAITIRTKASISKPLRPGDRGGVEGSGRERGALTDGAVVVTVTVTLVAVLPAVAGFGETVQVASEGAPLQVKFTVPDKPPSPPTLKVYVAGEPGATVVEVGEPEGGATEKSWPVPLSATVWGVLGALSLNERLPEAAPAAVGVNVTATVQVPAAAMGFAVEQVVPEVAMAKGAVTAIVVKVRLPFPVLVRVAVWELLVLPTD
jgi:hypothetical protein